MDKLKLTCTIVILLLFEIENILSRNSSRDDEKFWDPLGPKVRCDYLPMDFLDCGKLIDHKGNESAKAETGYGCVKVIKFKLKFKDMYESSFSFTVYCIL